MDETLDDLDDLFGSDSENEREKETPEQMFNIYIYLCYV